MDVFDAFSMITFVLVIYIMCAMPTKKDVRRMAQPETERRRQEGLRDLLRERVGMPCRLCLSEAHSTPSALGGNVMELSGKSTVFKVISRASAFVWMSSIVPKGWRKAPRTAHVSITCIGSRLIPGTTARREPRLWGPPGFQSRRARGALRWCRHRAWQSACRLQATQPHACGFSLPTCHT